MFLATHSFLICIYVHSSPDEIYKLDFLSGVSTGDSHVKNLVPLPSVTIGSIQLPFSWTPNANALRCLTYCNPHYVGLANVM